MRKRSMGRIWKTVLAAVAVMATAMALYVQVFERRSRQEEDRLAAVRLEEALGAARARLKIEILAELRAELAKGGSTGQPGDQPLPNSVLRRGESGGRSLQQVLTSTEARGAALARVQESLDSLASQVEQSDRSLRRDLEEVRAEVRRDQDVSGKALSLLLIALVPLVIHLLTSLWPPGDLRKDKDS
jgi:small-conductance mechanosensitive channel